MLNLLVTNLTKEITTNKVLQYHLINLNEMTEADMSPLDLKKLYIGLISKIGEENIYTNIEMVGTRIKLKNLNPKKKSRSYSKELVGENAIRQRYAIVVDYNYSSGIVSMIIDTPNGISGEEGIISEIAGRLGFADLSKFNMYNAYVENDTIYVFNERTKEYTRLSTYVPFNKKALSDWSVTIQNVESTGVYIGKFKHKGKVKEASLPEGIISITKYYGGVRKLTLPNSLKTIGQECFAESKDLKELYLGLGIDRIPESMCESSNLEHIYFAGEISEIGNRAFCDCIFLSGTISLAANYIGRRAFSNTYIKSLMLTCSDSNIVIDTEAFEHDVKLERIWFRGVNVGCIHIGHKAFSGCKKIRTIRFPKECNEIELEHNSFMNCDIKEVYIHKKTKVAVDGKDISNNIKKYFNTNIKIIYY